MSQLDLQKRSQNPEKIYYDIVISNVISQNQEPPKIYFNETRSTPFVNNSGDYYLSIIRFQVDTNTLPVFIPEIQPRQANPNLTIYSVTLEYGTVAKQVFIQWSPQNAYLPPAIPPNQTANGFQSSENNYYYCYNYQYFILLIEEAFDTAFQQLQAECPDLATAHAPAVMWDVTANIASITAETAFYDKDVCANPIKVYFNNPLYNLFSSFVVIRRGFSSTLGRNHQLIIANFNGTNTMEISTGADTSYTATVVIQEYPTTISWTPVSSIVFCSNTLPIVSNQLSNPLLYADGAQVYSLGGNSSNFAQIITDLASNDGTPYKPNLLYNPQSEDRLIDMTGNAPLNNIDISVFWKSKLGTLIPMTLNSGGSCSLKILFTKKHI